MMVNKQLLKKCFLFLLLGLSVLLSSALVGRAVAQVPEPSDDDVNRIARQLFCPICDNLSLDVCPLEACQTWRDLIRTQLADGWSDTEIKDYFVAQYGDRVLGVPPARGLNWLLYLAPPALILLGISMLLAKLNKRKQTVQTDQSTVFSDPFLEQVERDLKGWD